VTNNARRILRAAAANRRSRATTRWYAHHAGMSTAHAEAALRELSAEGRAVVIDKQADVYDLKSEGSSE
jgi:hypothetical protein